MSNPLDPKQHLAGEFRRMAESAHLAHQQMAAISVDRLEALVGHDGVARVMDQLVIAVSHRLLWASQDLSVLVGMLRVPEPPKPQPTAYHRDAITAQLDALDLDATYTTTGVRPDEA